MKKLISILLALLLSLSLCAPAFALTQEDIEGVWKVEIKSLLPMLGISEAYYAALVEELGELTETVEFTKDCQLIITVEFAGETEVQHFNYALKNSLITLDDGSTSILTLDENGVLTMLDPDGTTLTMTKGPKSEGLVGVWELDIQSLLKLTGLDATADEQRAALYAMMTGTMEFTADGQMILTVRLLGVVESQTFSYTEKDGMISTDGSEFSPYVIEGDVLTIIEGDRSLSMTRIVK